MKTSAWIANVIGVIIDEAHCIEQWGTDFREAFAQLEQSHSFVVGKPFMIVSATMSPSALEKTYELLSFSRARTFQLNLGNQRHNITQIVARLPGGSQNFDALQFLLAPAFRDEPLERAIVYVNTRELAMQLWLHATSRVPPEYRLKFGFCHSMREERAKNRVVRLFMEGSISVLFATSCVGLVSVMLWAIPSD